MNKWFDVDHLDVERLLADWCWLCPERVVLVARNAFGDIFLGNEAGQVFHLKVAIGTLVKVADSVVEFRELASSQQMKEEWFAESDEQAAAGRGLTPNLNQCIGFSVPLVFAEAGSPDTPYIADLYEQVSYLGDLNRQISSLPEGAKVRLQAKRR